MDQLLAEGEKQRKTTASANIVSNLVIAVVSLAVLSNNHHQCATDLFGFWLMIAGKLFLCIAKARSPLRGLRGSLQLPFLCLPATILSACN